MRIAVLIKQVPRAECFELMQNGRLKRDGVDVEMNAYCRRAVSQGVSLARETGGTCVVFTLGPPPAEDVLREAVAWGADEGVLITDPDLAGSDTLATTRALARALGNEGPWDLILTGRNSIDSDTGQVGPQLAETLGMAFAGGVRELAVEEGRLLVGCELDDGWRRARIKLPAVLSTAERLIEPCKVPPEQRSQVDAGRIRVLTASDLGPGAWGFAGSPTRVGKVRVHEVTRRRLRLEGTVQEQVARAVELLLTWGAVGGGNDGEAPRAAVASGASDSDASVVAVLAEPGRARVTRELLGEAAEMASALRGRVLAIGPEIDDASALSGWGADELVELRGVGTEEDVADVLGAHFSVTAPWAVLAPGTLWGREVCSRLAVRLDSGLIGDAIGFDMDNSRLVCWKPAFGGRLVAAITTSSDIQLATVRPGVIPLRAPRRAVDVRVDVLAGGTLGRVEIIEQTRDDDVERLVAARSVVCVGCGVPPEEYGALDPLLEVLGAELGASRKVTDRGWLPRCRQIGLTGHSVAPRLYVGVAVSGKFNHMVGASGAGTIMVVNEDPRALAFDWADVGIVGDWRDVVPQLSGRLRERARGLLVNP